MSGQVKIKAVEVASCPQNSRRHVHQLLHPTDTAEHCSSSDREVSPSDTERIMLAVVESRPNMFTSAKEVARRM
jgi:hypothetical protein